MARSKISGRKTVQYMKKKQGKAEASLSPFSAAQWVVYTWR